MRIRHPGPPKSLWRVDGEFGYVFMIDSQVRSDISCQKLDLSRVTAQALRRWRLNLSGLLLTNAPRTQDQREFCLACRREF